MTHSADASPKAKVVVVTGLSGSGKSTATKAFEDIGYFCVDNLPPVLLPRIVDLVTQARGNEARIALVADVRGREFLPDATRVIEELRRGKHEVRVLFLDAREDILIRRYSETRRRHPLAGRGGTREGIRRERRLLLPLRESADTVLDTTRFNVHQLRDILTRRFRGEGEGGLRVAVTSFGFRHGIPPEVDMVVDVRFLPNPNFVPKLKHLTGEDAGVRRYVLSAPVTRAFLRRLSSFLKFLIPLYTKEGKAYFTLGVGCTGGRHRSVAVAEEIARVLGRANVPSAVVHRDLAKGRENGRGPK